MATEPKNDFLDDAHKKGGFAFASSSPSITIYGMYLRDYFAGQALRGINIEEQADLAYAAKEAYGIADRMLEARDA